MELGKKVAIFNWEWGRNLAPRERQKISSDLRKTSQRPWQPSCDCYFSGLHSATATISSL